MNRRTAAYMAWKITLFLAILIIALAVSPLGPAILPNDPEVWKALASLALARLIIWTIENQKVRLPGGKSFPDWQFVSALSLFTAGGALSFWYANDSPILGAGVGATLISIFAILLRRVKTGEIQEIDDTVFGQTLRIARLPDWSYLFGNRAANDGWELLEVPEKFHVIVARPMAPRTDDRLFRIETRHILEVTIPSNALSPDSYPGRVLVVLVSGLFGKWLYIVGHSSRGEDRDTSGQDHLFRYEHKGPR